MDTPVAPLGTRGIKKRPPKVAHPEDFAEDAPFTELPPTPVVVKKTPNEEFIDLLTSCTLKAFHEADVEITTTPEKVFVVLYFPEVIIRNSVNEKHTIKDTYIRLTFKLSEKYNLDDVGIRRATYTYAEYQSAYIHSHVSGSSSTMLTSYTSSICLGSTAVASQRTLLSARFDPSTYVNFLWLLKNWISWESVEGGPYRYMRKNKITTSRPVIDYPREADGIIRALFENRVLPDLKIDSSFTSRNDPANIVNTALFGIYVHVIEDKELEKAIRPFTNFVGIIKGGNFEFADTSNVSEKTIDALNKSAVSFTFKDKTILPKIDYTDLKKTETSVDKSKLVVQPLLVTYVGHELTRQLNKLIDEET